MNWRLGIDLGTNSLGWAALKLQEHDGALVPKGIEGCGVRIFSDGRNPKDKESNAAKRREPRSARKNRDRYLRRRKRLMGALVEFGLMPLDETERKLLEGGKNVSLLETDPWVLRARALDEKISLHQLGRVIFHLHQRRGFKSNRKTDRADGESGKVYEATKRTKERLEENGARSLGELFGRPRMETIIANADLPKGSRKAQPLARVRKSGEGAKWQYDYYPTRELVLDEFDQIWKAQCEFHGSDLGEKARENLRDILEWQHPLKSPPVGKCTLIPTEPRAAKALPSSQRSRVYQEVNALRYGRAGEAMVALTKEQRDLVAERLLRPTNKTGKVSFKQIRKLLDMPESIVFNTESEKRADLQGDSTAARLMQKDRWGEEWFDLDLATQDDVVDRIINEEIEENLLSYLRDKHGITGDQAARIADCPLPDGYGNLSFVALQKLMPFLEEQVIVYSEAVTAAGFESHSFFETGEVFDEALPYYGRILERNVAFGTGDPADIDEKRYGKVANPTVHVALNQIRAVVNDLLKRFGPPDQIVIELARDLPLSAEGKKELERKQGKNQEENDRRRKRLAELKVPDSYENRMRLRLYEDLEALGKCCVYTGEQIALSDLFTDKVEIEHILPFSLTLDDGYANKTLSTRKANRDKGNKSPYDAFGHSPNGYDWEAISKRAAELPANKRWRFGPDAMDRYKKDGDFLARQLTDTQYIARLAKGYLSAIYPGGTTNNVWVIPGRLTSDLRWQWGLDSILHGHNEEVSEAQRKNRFDHRHHAIDAVVVACTDRRTLQRAAREAKENEQMFDHRLLAGIEEPWPGFRDEVADAVRKIIVSYKPDHGIQSAMHNDTAYGLIDPRVGASVKGPQAVVTRKPLDSDSFKSVSDLGKIRDPLIRQQLTEATEGLSGKDFKEALLQKACSMKPPVYKVRIEEKLSVVPIKDKNGRTYKAYKGDGNYCYDIWADDKGKWVGEVISTFDAYQLSQKDPNWWRTLKGRSGQNLIMRIRKGDCLQLEEDGESKIAQVYKFSDGKINMAEHFEANIDARVRARELKSIQKAPGSLQKVNARRVTITPSGIDKVYI